MTVTLHYEISVRMLTQHNQGQTLFCAGAREGLGTRTRAREGLGSNETSNANARASAGVIHVTT